MNPTSPDCPYIWPDPRITRNQSTYQSSPPFKQVAEQADTIVGIVVDLTENGTAWLKSLLVSKPSVKCALVFLVYPACPTRETHLRALKATQDELNMGHHTVDLRVLAVDAAYGLDCRRSTLPPSALCLMDHSTHKAFLSVGSVGDLSTAAVEGPSLNLFFEPPPMLLQSWRNWFDLLFDTAKPLCDQTVRIPTLVPAEGDPQASQMWRQYQQACAQPADAHQGEKPTAHVDPDTGQVTAVNGGLPTATALAQLPILDKLAQAVETIYTKGFLVTIDETSRIKPLATPVKAKLLGGASTTTIGRITHKEANILQVLDEKDVKAIERKRTINDLLDLLSYPLSNGNRWVPDAAVPLLESEIESRNREGHAILAEAIGDDIDKFIANRTLQYREDLNNMYRQLGRGGQVPDDRMQEILVEVNKRLKAAMDGRIAPRVAFSRISAPVPVDSPATSPWSQPLSLILAAARLMRRPYTDSYFEKKFTRMVFRAEDQLIAMNVLDDRIILSSADKDCPERARTQDCLLTRIEDATVPDKKKCELVLMVTADVPLSVIEQALSQAELDARATSQ